MIPTEMPHGELLIPNRFGNETMMVKKEKERRLNYIVIKIGDKVYSTKKGEPEWKKGCTTTEGRAVTKHIGKEKYVRIRGGKFVATNRHAPIEPIKFEIDIYYEN